MKNPRIKRETLSRLRALIDSLEDSKSIALSREEIEEIIVREDKFQKEYKHISHHYYTPRRKYGQGNNF